MTEYSQKLITEIHRIRHEARVNGVTDHEVRSAIQQSARKLNARRCCSRRTLVIFSLLIGVIAVWISFFVDAGNRCIVDNNFLIMEMARPAVRCEVCAKLDSIPSVNGDTFTSEMFLERYAYNGIPLLVKGGAKNWTALNVFNFNYFKELFTLTGGALEAVELDCQFFPYKTEFHSMAEVFAMPEARANLLPGESEWYVGWSNCHPDVARELRKHYQRPSFLPKDSESSNLDWLFMGGFGGGADIHIDYVQRPSWQAMITGKKSWNLVPSPECESICKILNVTMERGDIILVDTNMWYHSTYIHPGNVSITIGSEYD